MNYYSPYYNQAYNQQYQMNAQQTVQSSGSLINVPNEEVARTYPVAPGNSVTFKDENAPYIYTKTMGFSQLDRPIFEKYKLIKEEAENKPVVVEPKYASKDELTDALNKLADLEEQVMALKRTSGKETKGDVGVDKY